MKLTARGWSKKILLDAIMKTNSAFSKKKLHADERSKKR
jgi:hypothetical protein